MIHNGYHIVWFCVLYLVAAYIRLYVPLNPKHRWHYFGAYLLCCLCICGERFVATWITPYLFGSVKLEYLFFSYNSICTAGASIALFLTMRTVNIKHPIPTKVIDFFAPLCIGVYLLHEHPSIRPILWSWIKPYATAEASYMLLHCLISAGAIFLAGCAVEWLRKQLFRLLRIDKLFHFLADWAESFFRNWVDKLCGEASSQGNE